VKIKVTFKDPDAVQLALGDAFDRALDGGTGETAEDLMYEAAKEKAGGFAERALLVW
jgi:hypothetical protein